MKVWIRADGNEQIGTGHVMRSLAIAEALEAAGVQVCFVMADAGAADLVKNKGKQVRVLNSRYDCMEEELPTLLEAIGEERPDMLLVDSYFVTDRYLEQLTAVTQTAYMDDKSFHSYPVNMIINYNIYGEESLYCPRPENSLMGVSYAPLRPEFRDVEYAVREKVQAVLLTTGGSDRYDLAGQILEAVLRNSREEELPIFHVVSGMFNPHYEGLCRMAEAHPWIRIHRNVSRMADLMQECDIAITAGGSTMYELSAIGVPMISFSFVDNQEKIVETFYQKKITCFGGNYLTEGSRMPDRIAEAAQQLMQHRKLREHYSSLERHLVDGKGAARIAEEFCRIIYEKREK